jgi:hypothetical protein
VVEVVEVGAGRIEATERVGEGVPEGVEGADAAGNTAPTEDGKRGGSEGRGVLACDRVAELGGQGVEAGADGVERFGSGVVGPAVAEVGVIDRGAGPGATSGAGPGVLE